MFLFDKQLYNLFFVCFINLKSALKNISNLLRIDHIKLFLGFNSLQKKSYIVKSFGAGVGTIGMCGLKYKYICGNLLNKNVNCSTKNITVLDFLEVKIFI